MYTCIYMCVYIQHTCVFVSLVFRLLTFPLAKSINTADEEEESDTPCVITLPSTFRLERTNFVVTAPFTGQILSVDSLVEALRSSLTEANVDVLDFKPAHCVVSRLPLLCVHDVIHWKGGALGERLEAVDSSFVSKRSENACPSLRSSCV